MVAAQSLSVVVVGIVLGLAGSLALTRFIAGQLFSVAPSDPSTYALVSASLFGIGLLASLLPALRATLVDPVDTLRQE
jgi:ABC-type antimicrobial peptide transport system permease subunit